MLVRVLSLLGKTVFFLLLLPFWLIQEVSGEGRWYRQQRRKMELERRLLSDDELLHTEKIPRQDSERWLQTRRAIADSIGLPCEAIYPQDRLVDLGRMHFDGPDALDFVFRLERAMGIKISRRSLDKSLRLLCTRGLEEFRDLARMVVEELQATSPVRDSAQDR